MINDIIIFCQSHWDELLAIIGGIVSVATVIVALTPTKKDDEVLTKIVRFLAYFSLVNTKSDQEKIDNAE